MTTGVKGTISGLGGGGTPVAVSFSIVRVKGEKGISSVLGVGSIPVAINFCVLMMMGGAVCGAGLDVKPLGGLASNMYSAVRAMTVIRTKMTAAARTGALKNWRRTFIWFPFILPALEIE